MNAIPKPPARPLFQAEYGHFIGGEWVAGSSGRKISLQNPANQSHLAYIQAGNAADAGRAVQAAYEAFKSYSQTPARERQAILYEIAQRVKRRIDDFAMLETLNNGKPITEAHCCWVMPNARRRSRIRPPMRERIVSPWVILRPSSTIHIQQFIIYTILLKMSRKNC